MNSIIEDLYFGDLQPRVSSHDKSGKLKPYYAEYEKVEARLTDSMTEEQRKLFRDYQNAQSQIEADLSVNNFVHGFKCGARIFYAVLGCDE